MGAWISRERCPGFAWPRRGIAGRSLAAWGRFLRGDDSSDSVAARWGGRRGRTWARRAGLPSELRLQISGNLAHSYYAGWRERNAEGAEKINRGRRERHDGHSERDVGRECGAAGADSAGALETAVGSGEGCGRG